MGRYQLRTADVAESCIETKKALKERIRIQKLKLKDFIELSDYIDMPWEARDQTIGALYREITYMKRDLRKRNVKKN